MTVILNLFQNLASQKKAADWLPFLFAFMFCALSLNHTDQEAIPFVKMFVKIPRYPRTNTRMMMSGAIHFR